MNDTEHPNRRPICRAPAAALSAVIWLLSASALANAQESAGLADRPTADPAAATPTAASPRPHTGLQPIEGGRTIAQVGTQVILLSELMWPINQRLAQYEGQLTPEMIDQVRAQAMETMKVQLAGLLEYKLILNDLYAKIPPEGIENAHKELGESFEEQVAPKLIEQFSVSTRAELDARVRKYGSSLAQLRREFVDSQLARMWLEQQTTAQTTITRDDLHREYQQRLEDYAYPAKARWQELMVRFDRFNGDRRAAYLALVEMGNQVKLYESGQGGASFEAVAKEHSHGFTASKGGLHDWTAQGSLVSEDIDSALFSLPVGRLSKFIATQEGYHIIRVLEREPAGRTPFEEAQSDIRKKLIAQSRKEKQREFMENLRKEVPIWTIYTGHTTVEKYSKSLASNTVPE